MHTGEAACFRQTQTSHSRMTFKSLHVHNTTVITPRTAADYSSVVFAPRVQVFGMRDV